MSLQDHPRAYGAAAVAVAFTAGALVTLGFKDLYPDLERRYQEGISRNRLKKALRRSKDRSGRTAQSGPDGQKDGSGLRRLLKLASGLSLASGDGGVQMADHEAADSGFDSEAEAEAVTGSDNQRRHSGIAKGLAACIGNTPLLRIPSLSEATGCEILAKAELLNPGGSPKDRVALAMIRTAEASGLLVPHRGDTIYEGTVGSTGISIATLARALGYRAHICMPNDQSAEKSQLLLEMGAAVERVPVAPIIDPGHYVNLARRRAAEHDAAFRAGTSPSRGYFSDQFETPANAAAHRNSTGPEIVRQCGRDGLTAFVCGAGTAGTLTGVARHIKEDAGLQGVRVVAADPQGSGLFHLVRSGVLYSTTEKEGTRRRSQVDSVVEGIGMNRMTATLEAGLHLIDSAVRVTDQQACRMARWLVDHEGIFAGSSTAVNCTAAVMTALTLPPGSRVVTILCDSGMRHLSKFYKLVDGEAEMNKTDEDQPKELLELLGLSPREA